jgi:small GTP-binding protein
MKMPSKKFTEASYNQFPLKISKSNSRIMSLDTEEATVPSIKRSASGKINYLNWSNTSGAVTFKDDKYYSTKDLHKENISKILEVENSEYDDSNYLKVFEKRFNKNEKNKCSKKEIKCQLEKSFYQNPSFKFKVILLGNIGVGKTTLFNYYYHEENMPKTVINKNISSDLEIKDNLLRSSTKSTLTNQCFSKQIPLEKNMIAELQIWDTAGEEKFRSISRQYYRDADGILLLFDLTNSKSFINVSHWLEEIRSTCLKEVAVILIGTKHDLSKSREISFKDAESYSRLQKIDYIEVSAVTGKNIEISFELLARCMLQSLQEKLLKSDVQTMIVNKELNHSDNLPFSLKPTTNVSEFEITNDRVIEIKNLKDLSIVSSLHQQINPEKLYKAQNNKKEKLNEKSFKIESQKNFTSNNSRESKHVSKYSLKREKTKKSCC